MARNILTVFSLSLLLAIALVANDRATASSVERESIPLQQIALDGRDLAAGRGEHVQVNAAGVTLAPAARNAVYVSPPLSAPIPFNAVVPQWRGQGLDDVADFRLYLRSGDPLTAAEWIEVVANEDMTLPGDELITGDFYFLPDSSETRELLQVRIELQRPAGAQAPRLEQLRLTFIDTSDAPTVADAVARQRDLTPPDIRREPQAAAAYPKPFVVSRDVWCTDPACDYSSDELSYHPVSHLILHHTVTSGSNSIAVLQAIWKFHAITRGWGDIGYNYLVDMDGVLYEGHLGGDNVVGTHSGAANRGSMALSLIGDFTSSIPPAPMQESVIELFAWKADQMDIDVYDSSYLPEMRWGLPHLTGHRDVYGTTACPGDSAHPLLPAVRDEVARRIGFTPPHIYYDELSSKSHFVKSTREGDDYWWDGPRGCGFNTHAYYTWSVTETLKSTNWAEWRPEVQLAGRYEVSVYAPYCYTKRADTAGAVYEVSHAEGTDTVTVDQDANLGIWVPLGEYDLSAGTGNRVRLSDLTTTDSGLGVWFDAIRLRLLDVKRPAITDRVPTAGSWSATGDVYLGWTVAGASVLAGQTLELARHHTFDELLLTIPLAVSTRSLNLSLADGIYYWRLKLTTTAGETLYSPASHFGVDTTSPTSFVDAIFEYPDGHLFVTWRGEDAGSGVVSYNVEYRAEGTEEWHLWQRDTIFPGARFVPPDPGITYWFRSQARDAVNWLEPFSAGPGDISTADRMLVDSQMMLPLIKE